MRVPRLYHPGELAPGVSVELTENAFRHLIKVLRLGPGDAVTLFNGTEGEYSGRLAEVGKRQATVTIERFDRREAESPLDITLAQGIAKGERMDFAVQKAVELGVRSIAPVFTERSVVQLRGERLDRRRRHWQGVAVAACEQCGRNRVPPIGDPIPLDALIDEPFEGERLVLTPEGSTALHDIAPRHGSPLMLLIGPEGGLSDPEIGQALARGFTGVHLGPRVLRTETAGIAALAVLQALYGDL